MSDFADVKVSTANLGALVGVARSTVTSGMATISVGGEEVTANVARGLTLAAGDSVVVQRIGAYWVVTNLLGAATPVTIPDVATPPKPKPPAVTGRLVVAPVETRSYRSGKWRDDNTSVYQGQYGGYGNHTGCAFYGTKPQSLEGATVTSARIQVRRLEAGAFSAQTSTLRLVTQSRRPAGAPTLTSSTSGPRLAVNKTDGSFGIPTSWAQAMVDGTAGGLAVYDSNGSPYMRFAGRSDWGPAWTLTINWTR